MISEPHPVAPPLWWGQDIRTMRRTIKCDHQQDDSAQKQGPGTLSRDCSHSSLIQGSGNQPDE
jgi:hypothetical protein